MSLIPHTARETTLGFKKTGDAVNLEGDVIGKYIERMMSFRSPGNDSKLSMSFLAEHGFL